MLSTAQRKVIDNCPSKPITGVEMSMEVMAAFEI